MAFVEVKGVSHAFGKEKVLEGINLNIEEGKIFGLLGPSGAGKTTLVNMIVGILDPNEGDIFIDSKRVPSFELMNLTGYMAQSDALYQELSARENLEFMGSIYGLKKSELQQRIKSVLQTVNLLDHLDKPVEQFSGGMKRRLSLAASLLHQPKLLILDEPTVGIDPVLRQEIWDEFRSLQQQGITIIVTTHVMDEANKCDELALLRDGEVMAQGSPHQLMDAYDVQSIEEVFLTVGGGK
ncbi:ABC transporter ATP-binding protein [Tenuibacillus multivorans]|uniref:ABC-2 type transport system ATP-binding protein n=1 Tax=Tenuibacillus multivorans TaxID=237069 RepID=A0A1G9YH53_9BACI|nr:ABC transporter ATP-binding protein [Tenuibacillus multivorans]GEL78514.1 ABC transporter ATP-binding protein [Tenuibacillus multivorans]SDN08340.1 ABC-2 type transport system ATP-binding protein [Tenuibacillus multivorans]